MILNLKIIKIGSSYGVVLPKIILESLGKLKGDNIKIRIEAENEKKK